MKIIEEIYFKDTVYIHVKIFSKKLKFFGIGHVVDWYKYGGIYFLINKLYYQ